MSKSNHKTERTNTLVVVVVCVCVCVCLVCVGLGLKQKETQLLIDTVVVRPYRGVIDVS